MSAVNHDEAGKVEVKISGSEKIPGRHVVEMVFSLVFA
jgi:hypothetical protein